jgi:hypothetical protein
MHIADNQDALLDYLYEEGDPAERLKIAQHLQECAACSVALLEFQNVRSMLGEWRPPVSELGFRIVQDGAASHRATADVGTTGWAWRPALPGRAAGWLQAAAAVVLVLAGMAASQLRVDYRDGAVTLRARSTELAPALRTVSITLPSDSAETVVAPPPEPLPTERPNAIAIAETEGLLQRVRSMIDQSEQRQQRELALRLSQVAREVDTQHQADLMRMQQSLGQQQELSQRELMDMLVKTSGIAK